jgi:pilus assembly protein Flp/PilA
MFTQFYQRMFEKLVETKETIHLQTQKMWKDETGAGAVEYALVIAVVVVMIIAATAVMDTPVRDFFEGVIDKIKAVAGV